MKFTLTAIRRAVSVRETVTVARSPSGTLATIIPINKITAVSQSPSGASHEMKKKEIPRVNAMKEILPERWGYIVCKTTARILPS